MEHDLSVGDRVVVRGYERHPDMNGEKATVVATRPTLRLVFDNKDITGEQDGEHEYLEALDDDDDDDSKTNQLDEQQKKPAGTKPGANKPAESTKKNQTAVETTESEEPPPPVRRPSLSHRPIVVGCRLFPSCFFHCDAYRRILTTTTTKKKRMTKGTKSRRRRCVGLAFSIVTL